jgi:predicted nucleic acid-binding protein
MRIFLDANILFSAAKSDGAIRRLVALLIQAGHECWVDGFVTEEARRNLALKAPDGLAALEALLPRLKRANVQSAQSTLDADLPLPEKDRPVLAAAIQLGCVVLVTGDKTHFGAIYGQAIGGVTIHSPRSLAEALALI